MRDHWLGAEITPIRGKWRVRYSEWLPNMPANVQVARAGCVVGFNPVRGIPARRTLAAVEPRRSLLIAAAVYKIAIVGDFSGRLRFHGALVACSG